MKSSALVFDRDHIHRETRVHRRQALEDQQRTRRGARDVEKLGANLSHLRRDTARQRVPQKQSFGWTIQFHLPWVLLGSALALVWLVTVLAGIYPARMATRLDPLDAIREE